MFVTDPASVFRCPFCNPEASVKVYIDVFSLELAIWRQGNAPAEDLSSGSGSRILRIWGDAPPRVFAPCNHLIQMRIHAVLRHEGESPRRLIGRYSAYWDHPHFRSMEDQTYAAQLKLRLATGNPRGEAVSHCVNTDFRHQRSEETIDIGPEDWPDRSLDLRIDALFDLFPSGFLDRYSRVVRGFVCPCRSRPLGATVPVVK